ncbi:MAG TPA: hypothetical protein VGI22_29200, partial [Xanthobacteraceae bacterium]
MAVGILAAGMLAATAQEMQAPRLSHINPDWNAVAADIEAIGVLTAAPSSDAPVPDPDARSAPTVDAPRLDAPRLDAARLGAPSIGDLNRATGELSPHIAASSVPVLLPFDTTAFLSDRAA